MGKDSTAVTHGCELAVCLSVIITEKLWLFAAVSNGNLLFTTT